MPKIYGYTEILGDILITGSFSVLGSASTINTTNLVVSDTIISLGHSQSGTPVLDEGIMFGRGTGLTQAFIWDETNDNFALIGTNDDHTVVGSINIDSYSSLKVGGLSITTGPSDGYILKSDSSGNASWESPIISDTYTNIQSLQSSDSLKIGTRYYITDRKIWVDAIGGSTFSTSGLRQQTILDSSAYTGSTLGVWYSGLTPVIGDKAIWGGKLWENVNGLVGSNISMYDLDSEWNLLTSDPLYVEKIFSVEYDFINDRIGSQSDDRGNIVLVNMNYDDYTLITDWGDESIEGNISIGIFNNRTGSGIYGNISHLYIQQNVVNNEISRNHGGPIVGNNCGQISNNIHDYITNNDITNYLSSNKVQRIYNNNCVNIVQNEGVTIYANILSSGVISGNNITGIYNNTCGNIMSNIGGNILNNSNTGVIESNRCNIVQWNYSQVIDISYNNCYLINSNYNNGDISYNKSDIFSIGTFSNHIKYKSYDYYKTVKTTNSVTYSVVALDYSDEYQVVSVEATIIGKSYDSTKTYYSEIKGLFNHTNWSQIGPITFSENKDFLTASSTFLTASYAISGVMELAVSGESTDIIWDIGINYKSI